MPVASSSRPAKRARAASSPPADNDSLDPGSSASHLVSFLTGYDSRRPTNLLDDDAEAARSSDEDEEEAEHAADEDSEEDDDPDEDERDATPTKRAKTGLVGSSARTGGGKRTPRSTPSKASPSSRKTPTPRKAKTPASGVGGGGGGEGSEDQGFLRASKSDAYFELVARPLRTSGSSYSALVRPLSSAQYDTCATAARSTGKSRAVVEDRLRRLGGRFGQWEAELDEGFNLLIYGFGSKRRLLNRFVRERLSRRGSCVVVNGHFPQVSVRDVLTAVEDTLGVPNDHSIPVPASANTSPLDRLAHRIYAYFLPSAALPRRPAPHRTAEAPLYLVMHNLDSPTLRTPRSLAILALLASSPRIHLVASFDHVHTPLLLPAHLAHSRTPPRERGFNWVYHQATTYDDYDLELTYQRLSTSASALPLSTSGGGISEEGALQILRSVPPMALRLLKLLLTRQLANLPADPRAHTAHPASPVAPAFAVDNDILQTLAREKFIAREEERYNSLMGEFRDHGLVVEAGGVEGDEGSRGGGRWVWVPLGKGAVERVLAGMNGVEV